MFKFGMGELIVILLIILLLFGASRLPEIAKALARSIQEFKKASKELKDGVKDAISEDKSEEKK